MSVWKVYAKKADFKRLGERFGIDQVLARVIRNRGLTEDSEFEEYLYGTLDSLASPMLMKGMAAAVSLIKRAIDQKKRIRIVGDYDIDGICSIYILHTGLKTMGAEADYVVPDRITDGYGINSNIIKRAHDDGADLIITCDNGIAAAEEIAYAKLLGMSVIVTDHHDIPLVTCGDGTVRHCVPPADAVIDPKQEDCSYPFKELCGAAVTWRLIEALRGTKADKDPVLAHLLEFAAMATVGDIVSLQGENRTIVKCGLRHIRAGTSSTGLRMLMKECGINESEFNAYHIGYVVGPCLNASGRLDSAAKAIRLLETKSAEEALSLSEELRQLNEERKDMTEKGFSEACTAIDSEYGEDIPDVLVVYIGDCHESVAGIIAGRIREKYYRPAIIFTDSIGDDRLYKGSGRSVEGYNMFEKISECASMLSKFGGHPMAAGMSIDKECFLDFKESLIKNAGLDREALTPVTWIDVPMPLDYVTEELVLQLELLEPFGRDNHKPLFADRKLRVLKKNVIGKKRNVMKLILETPGQRRLDAVKFHAEDDMEEVNEGDKISIVYYPGINTYNGKKSLQVTIVEIKKYLKE